MRGQFLHVQVSVGLFKAKNFIVDVPVEWRSAALETDLYKHHKRPVLITHMFVIGLVLR